MPDRLKSIKSIFFDLLDEKALDLIAAKVSNMSGDIRVAFDLIKIALSQLQNSIRHGEKVPEDEKIRVTYLMINEVYLLKYGSKVRVILQRLPRQEVIVLEQLADYFIEFGEERKVTLSSAFEKGEQAYKRKGVVIGMKEFMKIMEDLEMYSMISIEVNKKEHKLSKFSLNVDATELSEEIQMLMDEIH
jgi:Cdc6-like AAA superfamily ATPase